jgi:hypothetical protein
VAQDAKVAAKPADDLVAELYEVTCEHVEMVGLRQGQALFGKFDRAPRVCCVKMGHDSIVALNASPDL